MSIGAEHHSHALDVSSSRKVLAISLKSKTMLWYFKALLHLIKVNIEFMLIFLFGLTKLLYFHRQGAYMFHEAQN